MACYKTTVPSVKQNLDKAKESVLSVLRSVRGSLLSPAWVEVQSRLATGRVGVLDFYYIRQGNFTKRDPVLARLVFKKS